MTKAASTTPTVGAGRFFALAMLLVMAATSSTRAQTPRPEEKVVRAVFVDGRLWILSNPGILSSLAEGEASRRREDLSEHVGGLCTLDGFLLAVSFTPGGRKWVLHRRGVSGWMVEATIAVDETEWLERLACGQSRVSFVTNHRLITLDGDRQTAVALAQERRRGFVRATLERGDFFYIGRGAGEWGGGLVRIDRRSGAAQSIAQPSGSRPCEALLDPACDPVNGLAAAPWRPDCIVAAIGLVHLSPSGRLVEICDDAVAALYSKPYGRNAPASTLPFFDLQPIGATLRALAADGLYEVEPQGAHRIAPLPAFHTVDGVTLSFVLPGVVIVHQEIGRIRPDLGYGALLVVR